MPRAFDTSVSGVASDHVDAYPDSERVVFRHEDVPFMFGEESKGVRRLFELSPTLGVPGTG